MPANLVTGAEVKRMRELLADGHDYMSISILVGRSYERVKYHLDPLYRQCWSDLRKLNHYKKRKKQLRWWPETVKQPWRVKHPFAGVTPRPPGAELTKEEIARVLMLHELGACATHIQEITGISNYSVRYWTDEQFRKRMIDKSREKMKRPEELKKKSLREKERRARRRLENEARNRHDGVGAPASFQDAGSVARPDGEVL